MEIVDRKTAISLGMTTYFTGKECKNGHVVARKVCSGSCCTCSTGYTKTWRANGSSSGASYNPSGKKLPDQDYLKECFDYLLESGKLLWRVRPSHHFNTIRDMKAFNSRFSGKTAGHYHKSNGYLEVRLEDNLYKGHRLVFKIITGEDPVGMLDHIDGDPSNNRIENLREVTAQENTRNARKRANKNTATSQYKGVYLHKSLKYWIATLSMNDGAVVVEEKFDNELDAAIGYDMLAKKHYGEFAQLNFK